jgi:hypothetical protein
MSQEFADEQPEESLPTGVTKTSDGQYMRIVPIEECSGSMPPKVRRRLQRMLNNRLSDRLNNRLEA